LACVQCGGEIDSWARICPSCRALQPLTVHTGPIGPGATIDLGYGRLVVQARVGEGGMGVVWRAWLFPAPDGPRAAEPPTPVALKMLRRQADGQPALRSLFANEADALRALRHPNVVGFHDFFEWGPSLALAMEFVEGGTLEELVARHRARARIGGGAPGVPVARAWYYYQQLLGALAATHALGFVHRDVKPSNVLIRRDGIVKLTDFGIARLAADAPPDALSTTASMAPGTGAYMSPEQVLSRPVDGRSDLYSAAVVFYELLAGRPPFSPDEKTEFSIRQDQVESAPPLLSTFVREPNPALDAFFVRALAKDPARRFASAIELGDAARTALGENDSPTWRAQAEIANNAPEAKGLEAQSARAAKLATLREFVVTGYQAANPSR
jgi:eukaryotic-like serine/threonine-protein kinase